jgi:hypothetical protein
MIKIIIDFHESARFSFQILMKFDCSRQIFEKQLHLKFH